MQDNTKKTRSKIPSKTLLIGGIVVLVIISFLAGRYSIKSLEKQSKNNIKPQEITQKQELKDQHQEFQDQTFFRRMVFVPEGTFIMGTNSEKEKPVPSSYGLKKIPYENEQPQRLVPLDAFYIDQFEVTNLDYKQFINAKQAKMPDYLKDLDFEKWGLYPMVNVSWFDAVSYCKWRRKRLPTEAEWEKAARGTDGRRFPWGNEFDANNANTQQKGLAPVGYFVKDVSPYGSYDMAGNVAEWVYDWYKPYPGNEEEDPDYGEKHRVIRGGSWGGVGHYNFFYYPRTAYRAFANPTQGYGDVGFRCAVSANSENNR